MAAHSGSTITLFDGRRLGFSEWGDPAGKAVLDFRGLPSSRYGDGTRSGIPGFARDPADHGGPSRNGATRISWLVGPARLAGRCCGSGKSARSGPFLAARHIRRRSVRRRLCLPDAGPDRSCRDRQRPGSPRPARRVRWHERAGEADHARREAPAAACACGGRVRRRRPIEYAQAPSTAVWSVRCRHVTRRSPAGRKCGGASSTRIGAPSFRARVARFTTGPSSLSPGASGPERSRSRSSSGTATPMTVFRCTTRSTSPRPYLGATKAGHPARRGSHDRVLAYGGNPYGAHGKRCRSCSVVILEPLPVGSALGTRLESVGREGDPVARGSQLMAELGTDHQLTAPD